MRETGKMDDLNCKIQAHVRVSEESKLEEKMNAYLQNSIERLTVRYYPRNSEEIDFTVFTCDDTSQHKDTNTVLYLYNNVILYTRSKYWLQLVKQVPKLLTRVVYKNNWAIQFHLVVDSIQLQYAKSVITQ